MPTEKNRPTPLLLTCKIQLIANSAFDWLLFHHWHNITINYTDNLAATALNWQWSCPSLVHPNRQQAFPWMFDLTWIYNRFRSAWNIWCFDEFKQIFLYWPFMREHHQEASWKIFLYVRLKYIPNVGCSLIFVGVIFWKLNRDTADYELWKPAFIQYE